MDYRTKSFSSLFSYLVPLTRLPLLLTECYCPGSSNAGLFGAKEPSQPSFSLLSFALISGACPRSQQPSYSPSSHQRSADGGHGGVTLPEYSQICKNVARKIERQQEG